MSTDDRYPNRLRAAIAAEVVVPLNAKLGWRQQECRKVYLSSTTVEWARSVLPTAVSDDFVHGAVTPREQFAVLAKKFCAGEEFVPPMPHLMRPPDEGIWRLRTADLRIIGWFLAKGIFLVSEIELKNLCTRDRDEDLLISAKRLRSELGLNDPSFTWETLNDCL